MIVREKKKGEERGGKEITFQKKEKDYDLPVDRKGKEGGAVYFLTKGRNKEEGAQAISR